MSRAGQQLRGLMAKSSQARRPGRSDSATPLLFHHTSALPSRPFSSTAYRSGSPDSGGSSNPPRSAQPPPPPPPPTNAAPAPLRRTPPMMLDGPIEEATLLGYHSAMYHPTAPDTILDDRYKTIAKLGYGASSTVWLAEHLNWRIKNTAIPRYVVVKVGISNCSGLEGGLRQELERCRRIIEALPDHSNSPLRTHLDTFELTAPSGSRHICLVYKPFRESLTTYKQWFDDKKIHPGFVRAYVGILLDGLDRLHRRCRLIHTDIKPDNVMIGLDSQESLEDLVWWSNQNQLPRHVSDDGHITYNSLDCGRPPVHLSIMPTLIDFAAAYPVPELPHALHTFPYVQPHRYRAPEVIFGIGWSSGIDIWNLGVLIWNMLENTNLFDDISDASTSQYDAHAHVAQMMSLLGPPPKSVVLKELECRNRKLENPVVNLQGKLCHSVSEFWGGPFFDHQGEFIRKDLIRKGATLADRITSIGGEEKEELLDFVRGMLTWDPEERKTAIQLINHRYILMMKDYIDRVPAGDRKE